MKNMIIGLVATILSIKLFQTGNDTYYMIGFPMIALFIIFFFDFDKLKK